MTLPGIQEFLRSLTVCALIASLAVPARMPAQSHIVSPEEMQAAIVSAAKTRDANREKIVALLSTPKTATALRAARVDVAAVKNAVSTLSDEELARLAARADQAERDVVAGRLSDRDLLWILVGIAALILIIVAVD